MKAAGSLLELCDVRFGYDGQPTFLGPIGLTIDRGQCWAIVGPNGAGKSTLIRLMAGLLRPRKGTVHLTGSPFSKLSLRDRSRRVSFLPQQSPEAGDFTVRDVVLMGRYPHRSFGLFESAEDQRIADKAMQQTGLSEYGNRTLDSLSGGEAQRAHLAAVLAQQAELILLDEPTASLDIKHQLAVFEILGRVLRIGPAAAVVVLHDLNLAATFCTHIALLHEGRLIAAGEPTSVLLPERVQAVYGVGVTPLSLPDGRTWMVPCVGTRVTTSSVP